MRRALSEARERCHEVEGATIGPGPIGRFIGAGYIVHFMDQLFQGSMGRKRHAKFPRTLEYQSQLPHMRKVPDAFLLSWLVQAVGLDLSYWHLRDASSTLSVRYRNSAINGSVLLPPSDLRFPCRSTKCPSQFCVPCPHCNDVDMREPYNCGLEGNLARIPAKPSSIMAHGTARIGDLISLRVRAKSSCKRYFRLRRQ